ncbi:MAG: hypothetical protein KDE04_00470 [Anaerolineales bacterium]|nr:hypothetical protein [Anaerolineales bacterium]
MRRLLLALSGLALLLMLAAYGWTAAAQPEGADAFVTANPNLTFTPQTVLIETGQTVNWTNAGGLHNVKADDDSFTSGTPSTDPWSFDFQFNTPGTYTYICEIHSGSGMTGTIIVLEPAAFLPIVTKPD